MDIFQKLVFIDRKFFFFDNIYLRVDGRPIILMRSNIIYSLPLHAPTLKSVYHTCTPSTETNFAEKASAVEVLKYSHDIIFHVKALYYCLVH